MTEVQRGTFIGMHAMNGSIRGLTLKRRFETQFEAEAEAAKLNAQRPDPVEHLAAYPCNFGDGPGTWGQGDLHWHIGRDRALRLRNGRPA